MSYSFILLHLIIDVIEKISNTFFMKVTILSEIIQNKNCCRKSNMYVCARKGDFCI